MVNKLELGGRINLDKLNYENPCGSVFRRNGMEVKWLNSV